MELFTVADIEYLYGAYRIGRSSQWTPVHMEALGGYYLRCVDL